MRKFFALLLALLPVPVSAQITVPNTFATRQVISSAKMNQNFDEVELKALNRTAPILQATLVGDVTATYDIGSSAVKFRDFYFSRNGLVGGTLGVTGAATFSSTVAWGGGSTIASSSNVALLDAVNTFSAVNPIILGAASKGTLRTDVAGYLTTQSGSTGFLWRNNANNADVMSLSNAGLLTLQALGKIALSPATTTAATYTVLSNGATSYFGNDDSAGTTFGAGAYGQTMYTDGAAGISLLAVNAAGTVSFFTNNTLRFKVNAAGDWLRGSNIMESTGTPVCTSGCTFGGGKDYAFFVTAMSSGVNAVITFGHTWTVAPVCVVSSRDIGTSNTDTYNVTGTSTTTVTINSLAGTPDGAAVICQGY